ncbi:hypothetical protein NDU88_003286 [Pleurodeles waltl]|uniref:Uncharacterized protein n=1 Tax=Pleurodeles waltl TaxID=8319 RepID=A0AAV7VFC7_PLEWA|nr:hypothetical protein NDU88_003286 [Pleurodeles waltl]
MGELAANSLQESKESRPSLYSSVDASPCPPITSFPALAACRHLPALLESPDSFLRQGLAYCCRGASGYCRPCLRLIQALPRAVSDSLELGSRGRTIWLLEPRPPGLASLEPRTT